MVAAQQRELRVRDGGLDGQVFPMDDDARYLVAVLDGRAVGCGAVQTLDVGTAEIKRMYVCPTHRGRGVARRLLAALEDLALREGGPVLRLETGVYLPEAIALYESAGYARIPTYGQYVTNPYSVCFGKRLPVPA